MANSLSIENFKTVGKKNESFSDSDQAYCQHAMSLTSRTFALNLPLLQGDLHQSVLIGYLLCRILDTVEDANSIATEDKKRLIQSFPNLLQTTDTRLVQNWISIFLDLDPTADLHHLELTQNLQRVLNVHQQTETTSQTACYKLVKTMAFGMIKYVDLSQKSSSLYHLKDINDLNEYCYYVAGTVGEYLTECFQEKKIFKNNNSKNIYSHALSFGTALQLVNIIKDSKSDTLSRKTCYIPRDLINKYKTPEDAIDRVLIPLAKKHCEAAYIYIHNIKYSHFRIRLFCIWPLWLAVKTLQKTQRDIFTHHNSKPIKISKKQLYWTLLKTSILLFSTNFLEKDFKRILSEISIYP